MSTALKEPQMASVPNPPAPPPSDDSSLWEKIGDFFSGVSEWFMNLITNLFGSSNERAVRAFGFIRLKDQDPPYQIASGSVLEQINKLEPQMRELSDEGLRALTPV